ncbi:MAG: hypothetical protein ACLGIN_04340 [Candidatus Sericytochromatia bacterium]
MPHIAAQRRTSKTLFAAALIAALAACSTGSPANPGGQPGQPGQPGAPMAAPGLGTNPDGSAAGAPPPSGASGGAVQLNDPANFPFVDPTSEQGKASQRFFEGTWGINGGYIEQSQGARSSSLTFRQYAGNQLGAGGVAPARYRADVTAWVYQQNAAYPDMVGAPLGIIGYAPYFRDETHYLLVVAKPKALEVWAVDGFVPGTEWPLTNRLFNQPLETELGVGSPVAWSVEVDTNANSAKIWANGSELTTVTHPMLQNAGHRVALVSNGNFMHWQDFKLYRF